MVVLPRITAPASRIRAAGGASLITHPRIWQSASDCRRQATPADPALPVRQVAPLGGRSAATGGPTHSLPTYRCHVIGKNRRAAPQPFQLLVAHGELRQLEQ